jgi:Protein of unknown function (DUF3833)
MKTLRNSLLISLVLFFLHGCSSIQVTDYATQTPRFDLQTYFNGRLQAHGVVQDRSGRVTRRMVVEMDCRWVGDVGTLTEDFSYSDGKKEQRIWTITKQGDRYTGKAADVVGEALGLAAGNTLNWRYVLTVPTDNGNVNLDFDDWMWQIDDKVVINRARFSKFGIDLGEVLITFNKL